MCRRVDHRRIAYSDDWRAYCIEVYLLCVSSILDSFQISATSALDPAWAMHENASPVCLAGWRPPNMQGEFLVVVDLGGDGIGTAARCVCVLS